MKCCVFKMKNKLTNIVLSGSLALILLSISLVGAIDQPLPLICGGEEEQILYVDDIDIRVYYDTCPCPPTDTADYDWEVDLTQSCNIPETGSCDLGTGTLSFLNTGYATCINTITTTDLGPFNSGQTLYMNSGCIIYVDG